jgi:hypothetical protein
VAELTLVTHCWAVNKPLYAQLLRAQLSSLVQNPQGVKFHVVVCFDPQDRLTKDVVDDMVAANLPVFRLELPAPQMWRRAIARHKAISVCKSDLIWFTDCDYLFLRECFASVHRSWIAHQKPDMIWPRCYLANMEKGPIDRYCQIPVRGVSLPDLQRFEYYKCPRAIGGVQCVSGEYARTHGYLPNSKWQNIPTRPFPDFRDDVAFRKTLEKNGRSEPVASFAGLYRLRHTEVGYGNG